MLYCAQVFIFFLHLSPAKYVCLLRSYQRFNHCYIWALSILIPPYKLSNIDVVAERCIANRVPSASLCCVQTLCIDGRVLYVYQ